MLSFSKATTLDSSMAFISLSQPFESNGVIKYLSSVVDYQIFKISDSYSRSSEQLIFWLFVMLIDSGMEVGENTIDNLCFVEGYVLRSLQIPHICKQDNFLSFLYLLLSLPIAIDFLF